MLRMAGNTPSALKNQNRILQTGKIKFSEGQHQPTRLISSEGRYTRKSTLVLRKHGRSCIYEAARSTGDFVFIKSLHMHMYKHTHPYYVLLDVSLYCLHMPFSIDQAH